MTEETLYIIGQILGILVVILGFFAFQQKTQKGIIIFQIIMAVVFTLHYFCLNAPTAIALNIIGALNCIFCLFRKQRQNGYTEPIIFSIIIVIVSIFTWEGFYSIFLTVGLIVNFFSVSFKNPQNTRKAMFVKAPLCLLYNAFVSSIGGVVFEITVLASAIIGLYRNKKSA